MEPKPKKKKITKKSTNKNKYQFYACYYTGCDKAYNFKCDLDNHVKTAHPGIEHKCPGCGKNFSKKANPMGHIRKKICQVSLSPATDEEKKISRILENSERD